MGESFLTRRGGDSFTLVTGGVESVGAIAGDVVEGIVEDSVNDGFGRLASGEAVGVGALW